MIDLGPLYHWSPSGRRDQIEAVGLRLHQAAAVHGDPAMTAPYLSLGTSPAGAWALSGDMEHVAEIDEWDLWEVWVGQRDDLRVRAEYGPTIREVKSYTPIPPDRLWWCGRRAVPIFREASS
jgi:hypothetical protein